MLMIYVLEKIWQRGFSFYIRITQLVHHTTQFRKQTLLI